MADKKQRNILAKLVSSKTSKKGKISLFKGIPVNKQGFILLNLSKNLQKEIFRKLKIREAIDLVDYLDPGEATKILKNINPRKRKKIVQKLSGEIREKVEFLLRIHPETAVTLMSLNYIQVGKDTAIREVSKVVKRHEKETGKFPIILVVKDNFLIGELPGHILGLQKKTEKIERYVKKVPSIKYNIEENEVIQAFRENPHNKIVVLDDDESIMGVIYSDDIIRLIQKKSLNSLRRFAGVSKEEDICDSALVKVKHRYKWLIINLATGFLAASVVSIFQETISGFVLLAVYMPIVAGMGGNAGTQVMAVVVRGLALKEIEFKKARKVVLNEILAGAFNGIINGALVAGIALLWNKNPMLGLAIGLAMLINLIIAGLFGAVIPLLMKALKKDPASSATVFITTATDVCGFFVFLGLATLIL